MPPPRPVEARLAALERAVEDLDHALAAPTPGPPGGFELLLREATRTGLGELGQWVAQILLPTYLAERDLSTLSPWCPRWWDHPEAVARLYALWMAWAELTVPLAGPTGPSLWHRDHLDPAMNALRSPMGPFARCMTNPDHPRHDPPATFPTAPMPPHLSGPAGSLALPAPTKETPVAAATVSAQTMTQALNRRTARYLSPGIREFAHYRGQWWISEDSGEWLRVDDPAFTAQLEEEKNRLDVAAAVLVHPAGSVRLPAVEEGAGRG
jgi:Domain of unknown function (DUF4913)